MELSSEEFQEGNEKDAEQLDVSDQFNYKVTFILAIISISSYNQHSNIHILYNNERISGNMYP